MVIQIHHSSVFGFLKIIVDQFLGICILQKLGIFFIGVDFSELINQIFPIGGRFTEGRRILSFVNILETDSLFKKLIDPLKPFDYFHRFRNRFLVLKFLLLIELRFRE